MAAGDSEQVNRVIRATGIAMFGVLVLLCIALLAGLFASEKEQARIRAHNAAHAVAIQFEWMLQASAQALQRIEEAVLERAAGPVQTVRDIDEAVRDLPPGFQHSIYDAQGNLTHTNVPDPSAVSVADRRYFIDLRGGEELVISPMVTERLTREPVIIVARRIDRDGVFAGAATVAIPLAEIREMWETLDFTAGSTISLARDDGMLIARFPPIEPIDLSASPVFRFAEGRSDGYYESAVSPADGAARIVGFWRMKDWPVLAMAGLSRETALQRFWRNGAAAAAVALPVLAAVGWLLYHLTKLMRREEGQRRELSDSIEKCNFLLREIHHRVKNNLQTVSSLIRLEQLPEKVKAGLLGRISAMVAVHETMYGTDQFEHVEIEPYLTRLAGKIAEVYGPGGVRVETDIAPVRLTGDRAMQLGLLTSEIVSNAFKHGFAGRQEGRLDIRLTEPRPGWLRLAVEDDGPGYDPGRTRVGMGSRLVEAFAAQLGGSVSIEAGGGVRATVDFPQDYGQTEPAAGRAG